MNKFFSSLKGDLLDRRLMPFVALLAVALLAAIGYAAFAGSSSSTPPAASAPTSAPVAGIAVSAVKSDAEPGAGETTGAAKQSANAGRNPFSSPSETKAKTASSTSSTTSSSSASATSESSGAAAGGSSSGSTESASGGSSSPSSSSEATPAKPKAKKQPQTSYKVEVLFGATTAGTPALSAQLPAFANLKRQQPLPSDSHALVVYRGVIDGGKSATFTLVGEAILRGEATCLPSTAQCQAIELKQGQTEELEEAQLGSAPVVYELYLASIKASESSTTAKGASIGESKAGLHLLRVDGLQALPGLRYSPAKGVLVFASHRAFSARAHAAVRHSAHSR
ncbi:MAG TPA: hypothetical protein VH081_03015 [Solirubrobacteraceae bacterium]|jgi:hypothetical protein|nr:hypothetical protein [Solirubrobacteraceae bacterium]